MIVSYRRPAYPRGSFVHRYGDDGAIVAMINPVTRSIVAIAPPFEPRSEQDEANFVLLFENACIATYDLNRDDPDTVRAHPEGWPHVVSITTWTD